MGQQYESEPNKDLLCPVCDENNWIESGPDDLQCEICDEILVEGELPKEDSTDQETISEEPSFDTEENITMGGPAADHPELNEEPSKLLDQESIPEKVAIAEDSSEQEKPSPEKESPEDELEREAQESRIEEKRNNPEYEEMFNTDAAGSVPEEEEQFDDLTEKQRLFCEEYICDFNGARSARAAGYSVKSAETEPSRLLGNARVIRYLNFLRERRAAKLEIRQEDVLNRINQVSLRSMQAYPVRHKGIPTGMWEYDSAAALKSNELLGKHLGMFITSKLEHAGKDGEKIQFLPDIALAALSKAQLDQLEGIIKASDEYKAKLTEETDIEKDQ